MSPLQVIRDAQSRLLVGECGNKVTIELNPGLMDEEIAGFEERLPCRLPNEIVELLQATRGFAGIAEAEVEFTGKGMLFEAEDIFPHGLPIASDGYGNFWVVDLTPESATFGPVYFACHDPPVILFQSASLADFLAELFKCVVPPHSSLVKEVSGDRLHNVWRKNPGVIEQTECLKSNDEVIRNFAKALDGSFQIIDLRIASPGQGFSWGRYGPMTEIHRCGTYPIFACRKKNLKKGLLRRIFGG